MTELTATYTQLHKAFEVVARQHGIQPFDARLLLAVYELGDDVRSDVLEDALGKGSATRRSLSKLYRTGHLVGAAPGESRRKRGVRTIVSLTALGRRSAADVYARVWTVRVAA